MGLEFQIQEDKVCYTPLKDKYDAIRNLESPKTLRQTRAFCGMVNFLSSFLPDLCRLLIPIYDLQKKAKKFKWTEEAKKAFNEIKKLLINPPVLKAPTPARSSCLHLGVIWVLISFAIVPKVLIPSWIVYEYICCDFGEMLRECALGSFRVLRFYQHKIYITIILARFVQVDAFYCRSLSHYI